jgi:hypothetical protein
MTTDMRARAIVILAVACLYVGAILMIARPA